MSFKCYLDQVTPINNREISFQHSYIGEQQQQQQQQHIRRMPEWDNDYRFTWWTILICPFFRILYPPGMLPLWLVHVLAIVTSKGKYLQISHSAAFLIVWRWYIYQLSDVRVDQRPPPINPTFVLSRPVGTSKKDTYDNLISPLNQSAWMLYYSLHDSISTWKPPA